MNVNLKLRKGVKRGQAVIMVIIFSALMITGVGYQNVAAGSSAASDGAGAWTVTASSPEALTDYGWAYSKVHNKLYYFGGKDSGGNLNAKTYSYDVATKQFSLADKFPGGNVYENATAAIADSTDFMYAALGGSLCRFSLSAEKWAMWGQPLPAGLKVGGMGVYGAKLYVFGQVDGSAGKAVYECDPSATSFKWVRKTDMPEGKKSFSVIDYGGNFYIYGGESSTGDKSNTMYAYDPSKDAGYGTDSEKAWTQLTSAHYAKSSYAWAIKHGAIYIIGGNDTKTVEAYSIKADQWVDMPSANTSSIRAAFSPVKLVYGSYTGYVDYDDKIHALGDSQVEEFTFKNDHPEGGSNNVVQYGAYNSGELNYVGEVDYFSFLGPINKNYRVTVTAVNKKTGEAEALSAAVYVATRYDQEFRLLQQLTPEKDFFEFYCGDLAQYQLRVSHPNDGVDGYSYKIGLTAGS